MPHSPSYRRAPAIAPLLAATACWGTGTVVTKQLLDDVAPLTLLPMQLTGSTVGVVLTVAAVACCALYTVATRQRLLDDASLPVECAQQLTALAFAVVLATTVEVAGGPRWSLGEHGWDTWAAAAASGCLYYGLAFWFYLGE